MKTSTRILAVLGVLLIGIQLIRPARTNPPVDQGQTLKAHTQVTPAVEAILERACIDCHSNETRWPWYSHVAPVSWYVVHDVNEGRGEFSISEWGSYDARRASHKLEELCEMVDTDEMPLWLYVLLHPEANLSASDKETLCAWSEQEGARLEARPDPAAHPDSGAVSDRLARSDSLP